MELLVKNMTMAIDPKFPKAGPFRNNSKKKFRPK
jgi:hypothetical protein